MKTSGELWINITWMQNEIKEYARKQFNKELNEEELEDMISSIRTKLEEELTAIGNRMFWDMLDDILKLEKVS